MKTHPLKRTWKHQSACVAAACSSLLAAASLLAVFSTIHVFAQKPKNATPVVVQPGAPGSKTRVLPRATRGKLPPVTQADVQFMQGMIMHHAQAVEMTALIESHTDNKEVRSLGARISHSQAEEIRFMQRWLVSRGQSVEGAAHDMQMHAHHQPSSHAMMPGMLSAEQMEVLRNASGAEFDRLFLEGMIQHHGGALTMVRDLFDTAGAGQDAELFNFATDVDSGQRAEIRIMQTMLEKNTLKEKR